MFSSVQNFCFDAYLVLCIKHSGHLRTLEKCRKTPPADRIFYISLVFSNARLVSSQCNTRLRLDSLFVKYLAYVIIYRFAYGQCAGN